MAERRNCNFCGNAIEPGTGRMYIRTDGTVFYFDRHKCFVNFVNLKRIPQDTRWSTISRTASKWKDRPRKPRAAAARVYAPRRPPTRARPAEEETPPARADQEEHEVAEGTEQQSAE